ncbi:Pherophorin-domain-containing protein [Haematococcus lacustris]
MAAELAGVAFNLGCGDQLHASSSCNGDVMFAGDTYCTVPNPEPPPPNTPPALPPSPSPSPPAPPTSRTPPPPAPTPPSPSPPPVSRPFPFSNCNRASDRSPWRMSLASQEAGFYNPASRVAGTRVCLVVFVNRTAAGSCRVDGGNTCCTMGMNKVDFNVAPDCQHSVQDVTVNGEPASPAIFERTTPVMKITGLMTPYATGLIDGVEVCFTLDETSNCPTLSSLCGGTVCRYAVYNEPQRYNCCPVSMFDASQ